MGAAYPGNWQGYYLHAYGVSQRLMCGSAVHVCALPVWQIQDDDDNLWFSARFLSEIGRTSLPPQRSYPGLFVFVVGNKLSCCYTRLAAEQTYLACCQCLEVRAQV